MTEMTEMTETHPDTSLYFISENFVLNPLGLNPLGLNPHELNPL